MTERIFLSLTVYNGIGLVRERRKLAFSKGGNVVNFTDVPSSINPESVTFASLTDPNGTRILEQNYVYDLVNSEALFVRFIDQLITVTSEDGTIYQGTLLSADHRIILQAENGQLVVLRMENLRDVQFPSLPDGLITRPTLRWLIFANQAGEHEVELTYLTQNISWNATYNLLLARDNQTVDLNGWITIHNHSGATFDKTHLKCVAGDLNLLPPEPRYEKRLMMASRAYDETPDFLGQPEQRDLFEYKLYEIPRLVMFGNNETKQIEFVSRHGIKANLNYIYKQEGYTDYWEVPNVDTQATNSPLTHIKMMLEFKTDKADGLDADLPAGEIRVYQADTDGTALLIGENKISHTPKGETVSIYLGNAFDIIGERTQTQFNQVAKKVLQESFEIKIRNRKASEAVEVRVGERLFRWRNWQILSASMAYTQKDSANIEFRPTIPADGEVVITYTVQYSW